MQEDPKEKSREQSEITKEIRPENPSFALQVSILTFLMNIYKI